MKIVSIGDSIIKGTSYGGVNTSQTFAYKIGVANGYAPSDIINAGVNGNTSADVLARLQTDVIAQNPAVCVVMVGINDWLTNVTLGTYQANIAAILNMLRNAGIKPVVISSNLQRGAIADVFSFQKYRNAAIALCAQQGCDHVDLYTEVCAASLYYESAAFYALYVDVVHLTAAGHQFVADFCARPQFANTWKNCGTAEDVRNLAAKTADYLLTNGCSVTLGDLQVLRDKLPA